MFVQVMVAASASSVRHTPPSLPRYPMTFPEAALNSVIAWLSTWGKPGPWKTGTTDAHVAPPSVLRWIHAGFPPEVTAPPPKKTSPGLLGSTFTTLSYQHCWRQMSGAAVLVQIVPPLTVFQIPWLVSDCVEESEIEAYTVLASKMPISIRPTFVVGKPLLASVVRFVNVMAVQSLGTPPSAFDDL